MLEPGRVIVGNAGILLTRVLYLKGTDEKNFVVVDGGMNDLIRPALYGSYHGIQPVMPRDGANTASPTSSGRSARAATSSPRIARSAAGRSRRPAGGDERRSLRFRHGVELQHPAAAAEVLVDGDTFYVVRERETLDDLMRGETHPRRSCSDMARLRFTKMHGIGNDYVYVDCFAQRRSPIPPRWRGASARGAPASAPTA